MSAPERSIHVSYDISDHEGRGRIREAISRLVLNAANYEDREISEYRVLDAGCGVGLLVRDLRERGVGMSFGMDFDPICLRKASRFGPCFQADLDTLADTVRAGSVDVVVLSHVLEHMPKPLETLKKMTEVTRRWLVVACPNPSRPKILFKYTIRNENYSNRGHYYSWDRSHFENFLTEKAGLTVREWAVDEVRALPHQWARPVMPKLLHRLEVEWLPSVFPYLSTSLVALCEVQR